MCVPRVCGLCVLRACVCVRVCFFGRKIKIVSPHPLSFPFLSSSPARGNLRHGCAALSRSPFLGCLGADLFDRPLLLFGSWLPLLQSAVLSETRGQLGLIHPPFPVLEVCLASPAPRPSRSPRPRHGLCAPGLRHPSAAVSRRAGRCWRARGARASAGLGCCPAMGGVQACVFRSRGRLAWN